MKLTNWLIGILIVLAFGSLAGWVSKADACADSKAEQDAAIDAAARKLSQITKKNGGSVGAPRANPTIKNTITPTAPVYAPRRTMTIRTFGGITYIN